MQVTPRSFRCEQDPHEHIHFGFREGGSGLVQDEHLGVLREGLGDLRHLLLADAEVGDDGGRGNVEVVLVQDCLRLEVEPDSS